MAQLLVVILHNSDQVPDILEAWQNIGVPGATILNSAGGYRAKNWLDQVGLSGIQTLFSRPGGQSKTLLSAIDDDQLLEQAIIVVEDIIKNFDVPHIGLYFTLPITVAKGILDPPTKIEEGKSTSPAPLSPEMVATDLITRETLVSAVTKILDIAPVVINQNYTLMEVAVEMVKHPSVHVASVVDSNNRLTGILPLRHLADDLFLDIVPEEFLRGARDIEEVIHFADLTRSRYAGDAMLEPAFVKVGDTVRDAFSEMHRHKISGVPIINDKHEVIGYINLLNLLALLAQEIATSYNSGEKD